MNFYIKIKTNNTILGNGKKFTLQIDCKKLLTIINNIQLLIINIK